MWLITSHLIVFKPWPSLASVFCVAPLMHWHWNLTDTCFLSYSIMHCFSRWKVKVKVDQLCPTLCDPMDYTVHGILQARIPEWVAFPFSRGSSQPRDWTQVLCVADCRQIPRILEWVAYPFSSGSSRPRNWTGVSCIAGGFFTNWDIREAHSFPGGK